MTERLKNDFKQNTFLDKNEHAIIEHRSDINIPTELKYVNISSSDRDQVAWPLTSYFEITLPDSLKDVTYLTLYDYNFYCHVFNFTKFYQNTKFSFTTTVGDTTNSYDGLSIEDGYYTEDQLLQAICDVMNTASSSTFKYYISDTTKRVSFYNDSALYNNEGATFTLKFNQQEFYDSNKWQMRNIFDLDTSWGIGYFLGFNKDQPAIADSMVDVINDVGEPQNYRGVTAPRIMNVILNHNVFLEIDGFNHVLQTRRETGVVNSYFSRIPLMNGFANEVGGFERANISMEKVSKLKFRLRFHNGILLDLQDQNFDLTLLFGCKK
jgi:hypothetical protein